MDLHWTLLGRCGGDLGSAVRLRRGVIALLAGALVAACAASYQAPKAPETDLARVEATWRFVGENRYHWAGHAAVFAVDGVLTGTALAPGSDTVLVAPGDREITVALLSSTRQRSTCGPLEVTAAILWDNGYGCASTTRTFTALALFKVTVTAGHAYEARYEVNPSAYHRADRPTDFEYGWLNAPVAVQMFDKNSGIAVSKRQLARFKQVGM